MSVVKKIPERMCVACRQMKQKNQLIRIVNRDGDVTIDSTGKLNGRGVYLCRSKECISKAVKGKGFYKQYGFTLDSVLQELEKFIEQ